MRKSRMRGILGVALLAMIAAPAHAAPPRWTLDSAHSKLIFSAQQGSETFNGGFNKFATEIVFDADDLEHSHIATTVDMASAFAGSAERDQALPGGGWFNVAGFPDAKFVTKTIRKTGAHEFIADAVLTIRGVSKDVQLPFTLTAGTAPGQMHAVGAVTILRNDYGVGQGEFASDSWIKFEVKVGIDILATKVK